MTTLPYINPADLPKLTPRETEVFELLGACAMVKHVAVKLGMSEKTVKVHTARVYQKLGIGSYREIIAFCAARNERNAAGGGPANVAGACSHAASR